MLLIMRIVVGLAIGVASEAVPVYIAEMTPPERRGQLGTIFQLMVVVGILVSALGKMVLTFWICVLSVSLTPKVSLFQWTWPSLSRAAGEQCLASPSSPRC